MHVCAHTHTHTHTHTQTHTHRHCSVPDDTPHHVHLGSRTLEGVHLTNGYEGEVGREFATEREGERGRESESKRWKGMGVLK